MTLVRDNSQMLQYLSDTLDTLKQTIETLDEDRGKKLLQWLNTWNKYLKWETTFEPERLRYYKRGEIVYANFGFNVGNEIGGIHYALVVENDNGKANGTILVVPLISLDPGESINDIDVNDIYLGENLIPQKPGRTVAKVNQICALSKLRIIKPKNDTHQVAKIQDTTKLDSIDEKITQLCLKKL